MSCFGRFGQKKNTSCSSADRISFPTKSLAESVAGTAVASSKNARDLRARITRCYAYSPQQLGLYVDFNAGYPRLVSPRFDLRGYKRARASVDLWYYDDSGAVPAQDYGLELIRVHPSLPALEHVNRFPVNDPTGGWVTVERDLTRLVPMASAVSIQFWAYDRTVDDSKHFLWNGLGRGKETCPQSRDRKHCLADGSDFLVRCHIFLIILFLVDAIISK